MQEMFNKDLGEIKNNKQSAMKNTMTEIKKEEPKKKRAIKQINKPINENTH